VLALIEKISADKRRHQVEMLRHGDIDQWRFHAFSTGYSAIKDVDALATIEQPDGRSRLKAS